MTTLRDYIRDLMIEYHSRATDVSDNESHEEIQDELLDKFFERQSK